MKRIRMIGLCLLTLALVSAQSAVGAPAGAITEFPIPTANSGPGPGGITTGRDGNVWFTEQTANKIGRITPSGVITEFPIPTAPRVSEVGPKQLTPGPDGNIWFTGNINPGIIGRITPSGTISEFPTADPATKGITSGPDGNLWFTSNGIGAITPYGTISEFPIPLRASPVGIAVGRDHNLWFTEYLGINIGRITPSGTISEFPIPNGGFHPDSGGLITSGPDGNLWFTEYYGLSQSLGNKIARITPSGTISEFRLPHAASHPLGITTGPDGNLWFTEYGRIGRITPNGTISEFALPAGGHPNSITAGPHGTLWFGDYKGNTIGRINVRLLTGASATKCVVPKLNGKTLTKAKKLLSRAHCKLGKVTTRPTLKRGLVVVSQKPAPRKILPSESKVSVGLG